MRLPYSPRNKTPNPLLFGERSKAQGSDITYSGRYLVQGPHHGGPKPPSRDNTALPSVRRQSNGDTFSKQSIP